MAAAVIVQGGKILLARRPPTGAFPLCWEFPGGKLEEAESPSDCLARELSEELGVRAHIREHLGSEEHVYPNGFHVRLDFLRCGIEEGTPVAMPGSELRWVTPEEALRLPVLEADIPFLRHLAEGKVSLE